MALRLHVDTRSATLPVMITLALALAANLAADPVPEAWVDAVAQVESAGRSSAIGDKGLARGAWQFHRAAWADCSRLRKAAGLPIYPYSQATNQAKAREYARTWLTWLRDQLSARIGRSALAHETWLAFNLGLTGFQAYRYQAVLVPEKRYQAAMKIYQLTK